ncbi:MAG TPA: lamin tail domain-containing protein [Candidatus Paceibacterota bacterium]|nr:lamin tail domain-containing protein [Candidatus Paceibacterota bacterium]
MRANTSLRLFLLFAFLALPASAFAAVEITHVEYDLPGSDDGREWVEIANKGKDSVDISKYKFLEGGVNHKLTAAAGSATLSPGASAVIAEDPTTYLSEHPGETRSVFKSSFSLSNEGETLALVNASGKTEYSMSYTAAPKPKPAPAAKKPAASKTSTAKAKTPAAGSAANPGELSYTEPEELAAAAGSAQLPPLLVWGAGAAAVMALGTAGALWARMQKRALTPQKPQPGDEFEIVP